MGNYFETIAKSFYMGLIYSPIFYICWNFGIYQAVGIFDEVDIVQSILIMSWVFFYKSLHQQ